MKQSKKLVRNYIIVFIAFFIILISFSYSVFGIVNPLKSSSAFVQLYFLDAEFVVVQQYPQIIVSKPSNAKHLLIQYMENKGFVLEDEEKSIIHFSHPDVSNYIQLKGNLLVSQWIWR